jgi:tetratricopeptide (TPR) repeat protein
MPTASSPPDLQIIKPLLSRLATLEPGSEFLAQWLQQPVLPRAALLELGAQLVGQGDPEAARSVFAECVRRQPADPVARHNLGVALQQLGHFDAAVEAFQESRRHQPAKEAGNTISAQGVALRQAGHLAAAEQLFREAMNNGHDTPESRWNLALTLLNGGNFGAAWPLYESRHERPDKPSWAIMDEQQWPMWRGEALAGKRLLVVGEQGLGDQIQFASLLPTVYAQAAAVDMLVSPGLQQLFSTLPGLGAVHETRPRHKHYDYWVYLLSLPRHLGLATPDKLAPGQPGFTVDAAKAAAFAERITRQAAGRPKIGLVWAGNPSHGNDRFRSMTLDSLAPLLALDACWVSLQRDLPERDKASPWLSRLLQLGPEFRAMDDTAAAIANLDLVISIDSAPAHLAASLGIPTWVFLPANVDWRWPRRGEQTFWYLAMRLFQQDEAGDWLPPLARVRRRLAELITQPGAFDAR